MKKEQTQEIEIVKVSKAGNLAKTLSNSTAQKILSYLKKNKKTTASQLVSSLHLPASTVHYNLKALVKVGMIDDSEFHYSDKGREVTHYALKNKVIVLLPEEDSSIWSQLKILLPGLLTLGGIIIFGFLRRIFFNNYTTTNTVIDRSSDMLVQEVTMMADVAGATPTLIQTSTSWFSIETALLTLSVAIVSFLLGAVLYVLIKRTMKK